jgi:hypothetical protein
MSEIKRNKRRERGRREGEGERERERGEGVRVVSVCCDGIVIGCCEGVASVELCSYLQIITNVV